VLNRPSEKSYRVNDQKANRTQTESANSENSVEYPYTAGRIGVNENNSFTDNVAYPGVVARSGDDMIPKNEFNFFGDIWNHDAFTSTRGGDLADFSRGISHHANSSFDLFTPTHVG
jgi:hypothetical protein